LCVVIDFIAHEDFIVLIVVTLSMLFYQYVQGQDDLGIKNFSD